MFAKREKKSHRLITHPIEPFLHNKITVPKNKSIMHEFQSELAYIQVQQNKCRNLTELKNKGRSKSEKDTLGNINRTFQTAKCRRNCQFQSQTNEFRAELQAIKQKLYKMNRDKEDELQRRFHHAYQKLNRPKVQKTESDIKLPAIPSHYERAYQQPQPIIIFQSPYFPPPVYPPHYDPYSMNQRTLPYRAQTEPNDESSEFKETINRKIHFPQKRKRMDPAKKVKLVKKMKKVFRAVSYVFYLKKLAQNLIAKRKVIFNRLWPNMFQKSITGMRKWMGSVCSEFFDEMQKKSDYVYRIEGTESQPIKNQKRQSLKIVMKIFLSCLQQLVSNPTFEEVSKIIYLFCKHGAFVNDDVLTLAQKQIVCISVQKKYLRLDTSLQKSQIINFVFFKVLLFNMLLQPWRYSQQKFNLKKNKQGYENFYYFSSVLYRILKLIQSDLLQSPHPQSIELGNWQFFEQKFKFKCCPPLCHLENNQQEEGEIISGLVSDKQIDLLFPSEFWSEQKQILENVIDQMHTNMRKVYRKFINQVYDYKKI